MTRSWRASLPSRAGCDRRGRACRRRTLPTIHDYAPTIPPSGLFSTTMLIATPALASSKTGVMTSAAVLTRAWQFWALHKKCIVGAHRAPLQLRTPSCRGGL